MSLWRAVFDDPKFEEADSHHFSWGSIHKVPPADPERLEMWCDTCGGVSYQEILRRYGPCESHPCPSCNGTGLDPERLDPLIDVAEARIVRWFNARAHKGDGGVSLAEARELAVDLAAAAITEYLRQDD